MNMGYVNNKRIWTLFLVVFSVSLVFGQDEESGEDIDLSVEIRGEVDLFLKDANKLSKTPEIIESSLELTPMTYSLIPRKPTQKVDLKPVPAAKITINKPLPNLFRGYAKGAVGTKLTGLAELRFMDGYSKHGTFDSYFKYFTSDGFVSEADSISDSFSEMSLGVSGKRFLKKHSVGIDIDYNREKIHYYGYDPDVFPLNYEVDDKRVYKTFNGGVDLKSYFRDTTKLNYVGRLDFIQFSDNVESSENNFIFHVDMNKYVKTENYALGVDIDYNNLKNISFRTGGDQKFNNTVLNFNPRITTYRNGLMVRVGVNLTGDGAGGIKPRIYPDIEVRYSMFDGIFIPYGGLGGQLHKNRYRTLADQNPFVQNFLVDDVIDTDVIRNTNEKINIYGGIRGNISSNMSFNIKLSRASFDDFVFFVNDSIVSQGNRFRTDYASMKRTTVTGELTYNAGDKIKFFGRGDFYIYDEFEEEEPWNQPNNKIAISASYNLEDKLIAQLEIAALGKRRAKSVIEVLDTTNPDDAQGELVTNGTETYYAYELDPFIDVTLKGEYRYTKRLSVFAQINNMIAGKYQRFNAYPVQRFNFLGGATYSF